MHGSASSSTTIYGLIFTFMFNAYLYQIERTEGPVTYNIQFIILVERQGAHMLW
jgi:hypothetical protein